MYSQNIVFTPFIQICELASQQNVNPINQRFSQVLAQEVKKGEEDFLISVNEKAQEIFKDHYSQAAEIIQDHIFSLYQAIYFLPSKEKEKIARVFHQFAQIQPTTSKSVREQIDGILATENQVTEDSDEERGCTSEEDEMSPALEDDELLNLNAKKEKDPLPAPSHQETLSLEMRRQIINYYLENLRNAMAAFYPIDFLATLVNSLFNQASLDSSVVDGQLSMMDLDPDVKPLMMLALHGLCRQMALGNGQEFLIELRNQVAELVACPDRPLIAESDKEQVERIIASLDEKGRQRGVDANDHRDIDPFLAINRDETVILLDSIVDNLWDGKSMEEIAAIIDPYSLIKDASDPASFSQESHLETEKKRKREEDVFETTKKMKIIGRQELRNALKNDTREEFQAQLERARANAKETQRERVLDELINGYDEEGLTLYHWAVNEGAVWAFDILNAFKGDINRPSADGLSPLVYARWGAKLDIDLKCQMYEALLLHGAHLVSEGLIITILADIFQFAKLCMECGQSLEEPLAALDALIQAGGLIGANIMLKDEEEKKLFYSALASNSYSLAFGLRINGRPFDKSKILKYSENTTKPSREPSLASLAITSCQELDQAINYDGLKQQLRKSAYRIFLARRFYQVQLALKRLESDFPFAKSIELYQELLKAQEMIYQAIAPLVGMRSLRSLALAAFIKAQNQGIKPLIEGARIDGQTSNWIQKVQQLRELYDWQEEDENLD
jgi:hypothetical protein